MSLKTPLDNDFLLKEVEEIFRHLGEWRKSVVLGGGVALLVYDRCLAKTNAHPVGTTDIDVLISRRPKVVSTASTIAALLDEQGFVSRTKDLGRPPVESWVKKQKGVEIEVEFLTDDRSRHKASATKIELAEVSAIPLSYLEMSLESTVTAILPNRTEILVVSPEAWVFHKGLTFTKRRMGTSKVYKDLYGIWFVLTQLEIFSEKAKINLVNLKKKYPASWWKTFSQNLSGWIACATPKDWQRLEEQDPLQRIKPADVEAVFSQLVL